MTKVAIGRAHALEPGNLWGKGLADLLMEAAAPVVSDTEVDGIFCASTAVPDCQPDPAIIVADRLGLDPLVALSFDCADVSGAAALFAAYQHLRAGACRRALVVGAAKVSDASEPQRLSLMDRSLDRDADIARGIDFTTQAGLLAGHFCRERGRDAATFAEAIAANLAAWAGHAKHHVPTAAELRRDLLVSPPLVRSDFAQLLDGGCALLLSDVEDCENPRLLIDAMASGSDIVSVWERKDPLAFEAVRSAVRRLPDLPAPDWVEIDAGVSVAQILSEDALDAALEGNSSGRRRNRRGGPYGRGRVIGSSALYQLGDIQELIVHGESALLLAVSGLGSHVFAARLLGIA